MGKIDRKTWKKLYFKRLESYLEEYPKMLLVSMDNVGSKQVQNVRIAMRGWAEVLCGKNTLMRRCIINTENPKYQSIVPHLKGNVAMIFTKESLTKVVDVLNEYRVNAPARVGAVCQDPIIIPSGPTGMDAQKTSFFQALNITTKIARGAIEIMSDVNLLNTGDRVGPSEAALLNMLGISPFKYGIEPVMVYDQGSLYSPDVLFITPEIVLGKFFAGVANVAAVSLALNRPNMVSVTHMLLNGYKNVLSVALATDISFPQAEKAKAYLADPSAFVVAAAPAAAAGGAAPAAAAAPPPPEEESDEEMDGFDLFD